MLENKYKPKKNYRKTMNQSYVEIPLDELHLDFENPRVPRSLHHSSKEDIINWMLDDASLIELMLAIGENGFFPGEPLLVVEENGNKIVVEGNRRLASLLLLSHPDIAITKKKSVNRVIQLTNNRPDVIPCITFDSKKEVNRYLGYRHITGIKEWSLLAKARYLTSLIPELLATTPEGQYRELAKMIGSKSDYIRRLLIALMLFDEIEEHNFFKIPGLNEDTLYFNYLMDSLNKVNIYEFIGVSIKEDEPLLTLKNDSQKFENFQLLINWFFNKNENQKTVLLGDSRHLTMLNNVLANSKAREHFLETFDITSADKLLYSDALTFHYKIRAAHTYLEEAISEGHKIDSFDESDSELLKEIKRMATTLVSVIEAVDELDD